MIAAALQPTPQCKRCIERREGVAKSDRMLSSMHHSGGTGLSIAGQPPKVAGPWARSQRCTARRRYEASSSQDVDLSSLSMVGWAMTAYAAGFMFFSVVSGYLLDYVTSWHRLLSAAGLITAAAHHHRGTPTWVHTISPSAPTLR